MDYIIKNFKEISLILSGLFAISIFFYNVSVIDGIYGFDKKENKLNVISNILYMVLGIIVGLTVYLLCAKEDNIREKLDYICGFFNFFKLTHYQFWITVLFVILLVDLIICIVFIKRLEKRNNILMYTKDMPEKDNINYIVFNVIILTITSIFSSFLIGSTQVNNLFSTRIILALTYILLFVLSGVLNSLKLLNKFKKYRIYFSKTIYFPQFDKYENYIDALIVSADKEEYIVKPVEQSKLHIKKNIVDMIQPVD